MRKLLYQIPNEASDKSSKEIIASCHDFVETFFYGKKEGLVILLKNWQIDKNTQNIQIKIYKQFNEIELANWSLTGMTNSVRKNLANEVVEIDNLGDISDIYCFYFNVRAKKKPVNEDALLKKDLEIRMCKIWINWFLPIYYIECSSLKGYHQGKWLEFKKIPLSNEESLIKNKIEEILIKLGYKKIYPEDVRKIVPEVTTDCKDIGEATLFDCLFSDIHYPLKNNHYIQTQKPLQNPADMLSFFTPKKGEKYFVTEQVFDENGSVTFLEEEYQAFLDF